MGYKSVEILDIRSGTVTAIIGEGGVNNTFVFKGTQTEEYGGYSSGRFYDGDKLKKAIYSVLSGAAQSAGERHTTIYVGVPAEFTKIITGKHLLGFPAPKKITSGDVESLYNDKYREIEQHGYEKIHASALYFLTSDARKVADPVGIVSSTLQANISYILCSVYFTGLLREILTEYGFRTVRFVSTSFAQVKGLLDRDGKDSAILLDAGMISSCMTLFYGDGIMAEETVPFGEGNVLVGLMNRFDWTYERAAEELKRANMFRYTPPGDSAVHEEGFVSPERINEGIKEELDELCEPLSLFMQKVPSALFTQKLYLTGEGVTGIRGAAEHISRRLDRETEIVSPRLPCYDKPAMSSRISLLKYALKESRTDGFFKKLLKGFGG